MNQPPLNPDALAEAIETIGLLNVAIVEPAIVGRLAIETYLAVAQPEVNSVEELDALPAGTLVKSGGREFYKTSYIDLPYGVDRFGSSYLAKHSKVTVIHRPEVTQ